MTSVTRLAAAGALALAVTLIGAPAVQAGEERTSYGHTAAKDRRLRDGCHNYRYRYLVDTPTNDWTLETFLVDPNGDTLSSGTFISGTDPRHGASRFRFCRYSTRAGTFTIRAKVSWYNGSTEHKRWFKPSHFRLSR